MLAIGVAGDTLKPLDNILNTASVALILCVMFQASLAVNDVNSLSYITSSSSLQLPKDFIGTWTVTSTALMVTSISFVRACFRTKGGVPHVVYLGLLIVFYGLGTICSVQIPISGNQIWHAPTAAASLSGFVVQLVWIQNMMRASEKRVQELEEEHDATVQTGSEPLGLWGSATFWNLPDALLGRAKQTSTVKGVR